MYTKIGPDDALSKLKSSRRLVLSSVDCGGALRALGTGLLYFHSRVNAAVGLTNYFFI